MKKPAKAESGGLTEGELEGHNEELGHQNLELNAWVQTAMRMLSAKSMSLMDASHNINAAQVDATQLKICNIYKEQLAEIKDKVAELIKTLEKAFCEQRDIKYIDAKVDVLNHCASDANEADRVLKGAIQYMRGLAQVPSSGARSSRA